VVDALVEGAAIRGRGSSMTRKPARRKQPASGGEARMIGTRRAEADALAPRDAALQHKGPDLIDDPVAL